MALQAFRSGGNVARKAALTRNMASIAYKTQARDLKFVGQEVFDFPAHYTRLGMSHVDGDMMDSVIGEMGKFCENVIAPINQSGDREGCKLLPNTDVQTPKGWKEAYAEYVAGGWAGLGVPEEYGGQGLPASLNVMKSELIASANWSWGMYPGLSVGAMNTLLLHGSEEQKATYLTKLAEGTWTGAMCLTEPHCGTDLGQVTTKAVRADDGTFKISGQKIFISCGENDFVENIVHIVLARIEGAPEGVKGISLFLVPRHLVKEDGSLEGPKNLTCGSIEDKMGIKGSSTCVMNFDDTVGYLIGAENRGLHQMFTFMNTARLGTGLQGLGHMELSFQGALTYARDRLAMRSLTGTKFPEKVADPIIVHPDVRKMLMTQKAFSEGCRGLLYLVAMQADNYWTAKTDDERERIDQEMGFLTPIVKAFMTEVGTEVCNHGIQVYGGHGFIKEWGMEQILRDCRISTLYEGTTGIQALDLIGRKVLLDKAKQLNKFNSEIRSECLSTVKNNPRFWREALKLYGMSLKWNVGVARIMLGAARNRDFVGSASVDHLMFSGYVSVAYIWLKMMNTAARRGKENPDDADFYTAKIQTGQFYFDRILPRADSHAEMMFKDPKSVMQMKEEHFDLHL